jgi:multiple sugar transport system ATP-binding protein
MASITLENLSKIFGNVKAVDCLNMEINDCNFTVLLGASGSGKSTTLNLIAGLEEPTSGDIRLDGARITNHPPNERDMAMVFQSYALYPQMTVYENIIFSLKLRKVPAEECKKRAERIAEMLKIEELLQRKPGQLSGGQQQRVALARAIIRSPKVFLLDEPLSNLDAKLRLKMRSDLRHLHLDLGVTTVYVTHDQIEAMTMADKIALLRDGKLVAYDTPKNLFNNPPNLYTADFLGSPPINLLPGKLEPGENGMVFFTCDQPLYLGSQFTQRLQQASDKMPQDVIIGVRPENVCFSTAPCSEGAIASRVYLVEFLGSDSYVHVKLSDADTLIGRVEAGTPLAIGDIVYLSLREDKIHVFDPASGERRL